MPYPRIVGLNGSLSKQSRTRALVGHVIDRIGDDRDIISSILDVGELGPELGALRARDTAPPELEAAFHAFETADLLVVGTPVYKGSYTGLFKHFIDFIDYRVLVGKPVALLATGGSERHALVVEHQLRPLFGFFMARTLPTAVFLTDRDIVDGTISDPLLLKRTDQLVEEARLALPFLSVAA